MQHPLEQFTVRTIVELLRLRAQRQPDQQAYTFLTETGPKETSLTYAMLDARARAVGALLQATIRPGERALLLYPPGMDYIVAFFGCLYAGVIAVPAYPPQSRRLMTRLKTIIADAHVTAVLSEKTSLSMREKLDFVADAHSLEPLWIATGDTAFSHLEEKWQEPALSNQTLAFIQYTSGSTSSPKGVMLTHANLLHNLSIIYQNFGLSPRSHGVSWLPPYHDMGLIGGILEPLYGGFPVTLMSPASFLQRPVRWLETISRLNATSSGGPNFAYDLCVRKVTPEQRQTLDLSSWEVAFTGAEPVRSETLERFIAAFRPCGFKREAFLPCYGLAESTLLVTGAKKTAAPALCSVQKSALEENRVVLAPLAKEGALTLVGSGFPQQDQTLAIVDPQTDTLCPDHRIGEIWISGPHVAQGYWGQPENTEATFHAYLANTGKRPFLRTGDLGFMHEGELFVTGRLKDLLIIRGLNHYPQDIELSVEQSHPSLLPNSGAAISSVEDEEERLVIIQEVDRHNRASLPEIREHIYQAVVEQHGIHTSHILLLKQGSLPKTSSGKIQRYLYKQQFQQGALEPTLLHWESSLGSKGDSAATLAVPSDTEPGLTIPTEAVNLGNVEEWLLALISEKLRMPESEIDVHRPITFYGLDSLGAIELKYAIESNLGITLPLTNLFEGASFSQILSTIADQLTQTGSNVFHSSSSLPHLEASTYALSYGQQALWFLHQLAPDSSAYTISSALRITGKLDVRIFRNTLQSLVQRYPALRTTFGTIDGKPFQRVQEHISLPLQEEDASTWDQTVLTTRLEEEAQRPFDLANGPLVRFHLFKRAEEEYILLFVIHHIISDMWSLALIFQEMKTLYMAAKNGEHKTLSPLAHNYIDYVEWQEHWLASPAGEQAWLYWKNQLSNAQSTLNLSIGKARPLIQTYRGATHTTHLPPELVKDLSLLAREQGITLYMVLLSALQAMLYRYTGQEEFFIGSPAAGRNRQEFTEISGYFVNPVVLKADMSGTPSYVALFERVRACVAQALEYQEYPFAKLVERLLPFRDASRSPFFQIMFSLQKTYTLAEDNIASLILGDGAHQIQWGDISLAYLSLEQQKAQFDLALTVVEMAEDKMSASVEYNTDLFAQEDIAHFLQHWVAVLREMVAQPERAISELDLLNAEERRQVVVDWNATEYLYPQDVCLHELVEQQVVRTPEAIALVFEGEERTYRELNQASNRLAAQLQSLGVGPDVLVGVSMERSLELVVTLLAILKAGGAYVPLDPSYPTERLAYLVADSQVQVLLTQPDLQTLFPECESHIFCPQLDWQSADANLASYTTPEHLVYMIYTSGSTGKPKGVLNNHRGVCNRLLWSQRAHSLHAQDRVLQKTPFSFDVSVWEFFWPLISGARLILARPGGQKDPAYLADLIEEQQITTIHFVPSLLQVFLAEPRLEARTQSLRQVICSGETLTPRHVRSFFARFSDRVKLYNLYGPTEAAIDVTAWQCGPDDYSEVPIGRPIDNTQIYLLDATGQPVPIGAVGEIYIGGVGVARGYHNRAALNQEKFLPDPFRPQACGRLFKTGDLARWRSDGAILFLGRADSQVKLRGFRIELGEIELALQELPQVRQAVVMLRDVLSGDQQLVAYLVPEASASSELSISALRQQLSTHLPPYMLPSIFVLLETLPLTANGKVDRRALLTLPLPQERTEGLYVAPGTPLEQALATIWSEVLQRELIGIHDDFFMLGGHSLLATQIVSRVHARLQYTLPLTVLFTQPTIHALAAWMESHEIQVTEQEKVSIPVLPREQYRRSLALFQESTLKNASDSEPAEVLAFPLSFAQERLWFLDHWEPRSAQYQMPIVVSMRGSLNQHALEQCFRTLLTRHEILRTCFRLSDNGQPRQVILSQVQFSLPLVVLETPDSPAALAAAIERYSQQDLLQPFELTQAPLLRAILLQVTSQEHILLLTLHHIIADGWSLGVLMREIGQLYKAYLQAEASPLPALRIQYADYAVWQRNWQASEEYATQLQYWRDQLAEIPRILQLPIDHPRPAVQTAQGGHLRFTLPSELVQAVQTLSQQEGVTPYMTLLSAFQLLLGRYSGQEDIVVGTPIANRTHYDTEHLPGCFVNTLVLRTDLSGQPTVRELLARVRVMTTQAYAHQELPFEQLVKDLQLERDPSYPPLVQAFFALQNMPLPTFHLQGLEVSAQARESGTAKFDLSLILNEEAQGWLGEFEYKTALFERPTIERLARHWVAILREMVAQPEQAISELDLLNAEERRQVVVNWNATERVFPQGLCLHELVEQQVVRTPEAIALVFEGEERTYRELNAQANQLARYLQEQGVGPEIYVGVYMDRSLLFIVGLLAILKAGGVYLPLDPGYPSERLSYMLTDARPALVLTQSALLATIAACVPASVQVVPLDQAQEQWSQRPTGNVGTPMSMENLAYMIYTSGSTGLPKGTMISHQSICNNIYWHTEDYPLSLQDCVLQRTSLSFDPSIWEIFWPLASGAKLLLPRPDGEKDIPYLLSLLRQEKVSIINISPSLLPILIEGTEWTECKSVRIVVCGGEALPTDVPRRFSERSYNWTQLWNIYGPTEATIDATFWPCRQDEIQEKNDLMVPIGRPIPNTQIFLLDKQGAPVPIGIPGELYIGGAGLARGYLHQPGLTSEKFIPHPFSTTPGARLYKTGDLARYRPDGNIDFLGRLDHQVKLRGFRIELGEIEGVLRQHPVVKTAIVTIKEGARLSKRLVAYVVQNAVENKGEIQPLEAGAELHEDLRTPTLEMELRSYLRHTLPEFMVPSNVVFLERIPLTVNGKVDYTALSLPIEASRSETLYISPENELEQMLVAIWLEVLQVDKVGTYDNFFELGGQSLAMIQVHSKLREHIDNEISVVDLFKYPTIHSLAQYLHQAQTGKSIATEGVQRAEKRKGLMQRQRQNGQHRSTTPAK